LTSLSSKIQVLNPFSLDSINPAECFTISGIPKSIQLRRCTCATKINETKPNCNFISPASNQINSGDEPIIEINSSDVHQMALLNKTQRNTIKRLEVLKKIAIKFNKQKEDKEPKSGSLHQQQLQQQQQQLVNSSLNRTQRQCVVHSNSMQMFVLDIEQVMNTFKKSSIVNWQTPVAHFKQAPPDTILFSLVYCIDEIILFGGMESDSPLKSQIKNCNDYSKNRISNKLFVMKPSDANWL